VNKSIYEVGQGLTERAGTHLFWGGTASAEEIRRREQSARDAVAGGNSHNLSEKDVVETSGRPKKMVRHFNVLGGIHRILDETMKKDWCQKEPGEGRRMWELSGRKRDTCTRRAKKTQKARRRP